jgi:CHAD domain-containing protein
MVRALRSERFERAVEAQERAAAALAASDGASTAEPIGDLAGERIASVYKKMTAQGRAIDASSAPELLHELRKKGKELRYLLELFGGIYPASAVKPLVRSLKDLQDVLGRFQDRQVQAEFLRDLGPELVAAPDGSRTLMAMGLLVDRLHEQQQAARDDFTARFAAFDAAEVRAVVRSTFRNRS